MGIYRIRNGNAIEEYTDDEHVARQLAWKLAIDCIGFTQAKTIVVEQMEKRGETSAEDEGVAVDAEISTGRLNSGTSTHLLYRRGGEQKWHARCRSVTRHSKGMPHVHQTGGSVDCKACTAGRA